jgi:hypothetical protein
LVSVAPVAELARLGRMTGAGRGVFAARTAERTGVFSAKRTTPARLEKGPVYRALLR